MERPEIIVTWHKLMPFEKELVVALYNIRCGPMSGESYTASSAELWSQVQIWHPRDGYTATGDPIDDAEESDISIWDAWATVTTEGMLMLSGNSGPSGQQPHLEDILPEETRIKLQTWVQAER